MIDKSWSLINGDGTLRRFLCDFGRKASQLTNIFLLRNFEQSFICISQSSVVSVYS